MSRPRRDLVGTRQKRLLITEALPPDPKRPRKGGAWRCMCDCGRECIVMNENIASRASCGKCPRDPAAYSASFRKNKFALKRGENKRKCRICGDTLPPDRYFNHVRCFGQRYEGMDNGVVEQTVMGVK